MVDFPIFSFSDDFPMLFPAINSSVQFEDFSAMELLPWPHRHPPATERWEDLTTPLWSRCTSAAVYSGPSCRTSFCPASSGRDWQSSGKLGGPLGRYQRYTGIPHWVTQWMVGESTPNGIILVWNILVLIYLRSMERHHQLGISDITRQERGSERNELGEFKQDAFS